MCAVLPVPLFRVDLVMILSCEEYLDSIWQRRQTEHVLILEGLSHNWACLTAIITLRNIEYLGNECDHDMKDPISQP